MFTIAEGFLILQNGIIEHISEKETAIKLHNQLLDFEFSLAKKVGCNLSQTKEERILEFSVRYDKAKAELN